MIEEKGSHADRLMADLRAKISSIANEADLSTEDCVAFYRKETEYADWLKRHQNNGYVLHRTSGSAKETTLHTSACPVIGGGEDSGIWTTQPKVGCPTKSSAVSFARTKKWKLLTNCEQCQKPATA